MECKQLENAAQCTCSSETCDRRGICCDCVSHHRNKGQLPGCLRDLTEV